MTYIFTNWPQVYRLLVQHVSVTVAALVIATLIALPVSWLLDRYRYLQAPILGILGLLYTIPSIALMILLIPFFGLGQRSVLVALVIYSQIILVRNMLTGLGTIDPTILEVARGIGMSPLQIAARVQFPLALPVILAGLRVAAVAVVAIAAVGARFGAGGLGVLMFEGIAQAGRYDKIVAGGFMAALLALIANGGLRLAERAVRRADIAVVLPV